MPLAQLHDRLNENGESECRHSNGRLLGLCRGVGLFLLTRLAGIRYTILDRPELNAKPQRPEPGWQPFAEDYAKREASGTGAGRRSLAERAGCGHPCCLWRGTPDDDDCPAHGHEPSAGVADRQKLDRAPYCAAYVQVGASVRITEAVTLPYQGRPDSGTLAGSLSELPDLTWEEFEEASALATHDLAAT